MKKQSGVVVNMIFLKKNYCIYKIKVKKELDFSFIH